MKVLWIPLLAAVTGSSMPRTAVAWSGDVGNAKAMISNLTASLDQYAADTGSYPGEGTPRNENAFPALFEALFGEKPPKGQGGPKAPYWKFTESDVLIWNRELEDFRPANEQEIYSPEIKRYLADPWGQPYVYRLLGNPSPLHRFQGKRFIIYSTGPDRIDQTSAGEIGDDINNWELLHQSSGSVVIVIVALASAVILLLAGWITIRGRKPEKD